MGVLIAADVPEALDPLEIKHSQEGSPYTTRSSIGWAVNGPLGCHGNRSKTSCFFIKADPQLYQMVEEFYSREYSESIANDKTEMSQEEMRFMQNAKETVRLENSRYQISLPFKDCDILGPNNKTQVLQRATTSCKNSGDTSTSWGVINLPLISHTAAPSPPPHPLHSQH